MTVEYVYTDTHMHLRNISFIESLRLFMVHFTDIPAVNTQRKQSSQHTDMLHPYQYFSSTLDHLYPW